MRNTESLHREGFIFDIQGHSVHDGPGGRTLLFMGGCSLRCEWCANPEGIVARPQLMYRDSRCSCRSLRCVSACPHGAILPSQKGNPPVVINREHCASCKSYECVKNCYSEALSLCGRNYTVDALMKVVQRDRDYWGPEGGVTLGGGDPLFQMGFSSSLLQQCRAHFIHTAIETSACAPTESFLRFMADVDWAFIDIKHMDSARHRDKTGAGNEMILKNIRKLMASGWPGTLIIRTPVVPGYNDSTEHMSDMAAFLKSCRIGTVNLLPFHRLGESKYRQLGREYLFQDILTPPAEKMEELKEQFTRSHISCYIGYDTPF